LRASNRGDLLTETGERHPVEADRRTALYFLATLHLARLLGASPETKRVRSERRVWLPMFCERLKERI